MKQMKKEYMSLLLVGAMAGMLFAGCGKDATVERVGPVSRFSTK